MALRDDDRRKIEQLHERRSAALEEARLHQAAIDAIYQAAGEDPPPEHRGEAPSPAGPGAPSRPPREPSSAGGDPASEGTMRGGPEIAESPLDTPAP